MGIYPVTSITGRTTDADGSESWTETIDDFSGVRRSRRVVAGPWLAAARTDCFCCSCGDREGSDSFCRNHGHAGERPCEAHRMPGKPDEDGVMPESVQAHREQHLWDER